MVLIRLPGATQELAVPEILAGRDAVLAAETGSGKTLAYLAPLAELALQKRRQAAAAAAARDGEEQRQGPGDVWRHPRQEGEPDRRRRHTTAALVLCPNMPLCEQVLAAAQSLRDPATGAPLAAAALVSAQSPPPLAMPDVVVTTPGALLSLLDVAGPAYGYEWTRAGQPRAALEEWQGMACSHLRCLVTQPQRAGAASCALLGREAAPPCSPLPFAALVGTPQPRPLSRWAGRAKHGAGHQGGAASESAPVLAPLPQVCPAGHGPLCLTRPTCCCRVATERRCA